MPWQHIPIIFLPVSWNTLLFFLSSSIVFFFSSVCCSLRLMASASRSAFVRNLGWREEEGLRREGVRSRVRYKVKGEGLSWNVAELHSPLPRLPPQLSSWPGAPPAREVGPDGMNKAIRITCVFFRIHLWSKSEYSLAIYVTLSFFFFSSSSSVFISFSLLSLASLDFGDRLLNYKNNINNCISNISIDFLTQKKQQCSIMNEDKFTIIKNTVVLRVIVVQSYRPWFLCSITPVTIFLSVFSGTVSLFALLAPLLIFQPPASVKNKQEKVVC